MIILYFYHERPVFVTYKTIFSCNFFVNMWSLFATAYVLVWFQRSVAEVTVRFFNIRIGVDSKICFRFRIKLLVDQYFSLRLVLLGSNNTT